MIHTAMSPTSSRRRPSGWIFSAALSLLHSASGCGDSADEAHLEHVIPHHKPASAALAVDQLQVRGAERFSGASSADQTAELSDIISWLPELAADTDVRRPQWERIRDISVELSRLSGPAVLPAGDASQQRWDELIAELDDLVPEADPAPISHSRHHEGEHEHVEDMKFDPHASHAHSGEHD